MLSKTIIAAALVSQALAYPFVAEMPGVDSSLLKKAKRQQPGSAATCPYNKNHQGAAPYTAKYPYCHSVNGSAGVFPCANNLVPANGDTAHYFVAPGPNDIRGPCPGLNTAANHNFLSHDGITTFNELVSAQQNVYGVGYDLAVLLATLGVGLDGDPITEKVSIGCDATSRTAAAGNGPELGLDGHNKFEGDTSLSRNDYFLGPPVGNNYLYNSTLYAMMSKTCNGNFNRANLAKYRYQRYQQSLMENGNFYFGPKSVLLYGAASFLYELFPSGGENGAPSQAIEDSFFQLQKIPANWLSRSDPYTIPLVANEINQQYQLYPVAFGGNTGKPNSFVGIGETGPYFNANSTMNATPQGVACLLYQIATEDVPASAGGGSGATPTANFAWAASKLNPLYSTGTLGSFGCPLNFNAA